MLGIVEVIVKKNSLVTAQDTVAIRNNLPRILADNLKIPSPAASSLSPQDLSIQFFDFSKEDVIPRDLIILISVNRKRIKKSQIKERQNEITRELIKTIKTGGLQAYVEIRFFSSSPQDCGT